MPRKQSAVQEVENEEVEIQEVENVAPEGDTKAYTIIDHSVEIERDRQALLGLADQQEMLDTKLAELDEKATDPDPEVAFVAEGAKGIVQARIDRVKRATEARMRSWGRWDVDLELAEVVAAALATAEQLSDASVFVTLKAPNTIEATKIYVVAEGQLERRTVQIKVGEQSDGTSNTEPESQIQGRVQIVFSAPSLRREIEPVWLDRYLMRHDLLTGGEGLWLSESNIDAGRFTQTLSLPHGQVIRRSATSVRGYLSGRHEARALGRDRDRFGREYAV